MDQIEGRVAVVTGGGSGMGRASALSFARAGAHVVIADIDADRAERVAGEVAALGVQGVGVPCDVALLEDLTAVNEIAQSRFGHVDIVMNNAGVSALGDPLEIPMERWRRLIDVNLIGIAWSNEVFLPGLIAQGSGHIVNTASIAGIYQYTSEMLPYSATKAAVVAMSEALALYLRPRGIGITVLCPGPVLTNIVEQTTMHGDITPTTVPLEFIEPEGVGDMVVNAVRENRFLLLTHPDEVHDILVRKATDPEGFLASQLE